MLLFFFLQLVVLNMLEFSPSISEVEAVEISLPSTLSLRKKEVVIATEET